MKSVFAETHLPQNFIMTPSLLCFRFTEPQIVGLRFLCRPIHIQGDFSAGWESMCLQPTKLTLVQENIVSKVGKCLLLRDPLAAAQFSHISYICINLQTICPCPPLSLGPSHWISLPCPCLNTWSKRSVYSFIIKFSLPISSQEIKPKPRSGS